MIRLTLDLLPQGNPRAPRRLATIEIEHVGDDAPTGDYVVRLIDGERVRAGATIEGFDRARGALALALVREALGAMEGAIDVAVRG